MKSTIKECQLITEKNDPLAQKKIVRIDDLKGRVLMVGGDSQPELRAVQNRVIQKLNLNHFNSNDVETTLTNVAAHLCTHSNDKKKELTDFINILQNFYRSSDFAV